MGRAGWENCVGGKMREGCERGQREAGGQMRSWGVYRGRGVYMDVGRGRRSSGGGGVGRSSERVGAGRYRGEKGLGDMGKGRRGCNAACARGCEFTAPACNVFALMTVRKA